VQQQLVGLFFLAGHLPCTSTAAAGPVSLPTARQDQVASLPSSWNKA
jgi:hypothetical protein